MGGYWGEILYFLPVTHYSDLLPHPDPLPGSIWDVPPIGRPEMLVVLMASLVGAYALFRRADLK